LEIFSGSLRGSVLSGAIHYMTSDILLATE